MFHWKCYISWFIRKKKRLDDDGDNDDDDDDDDDDDGDGDDAAADDDDFDAHMIKRLKIALALYIIGLGEIGPEDPNFKIKTWALGFWWEIEF